MNEYCSIIGIIIRVVIDLNIGEICDIISGIITTTSLPPSMEPNQGHEAPRRPRSSLSRNCACHCRG